MNSAVLPSQNLLIVDDEPAELQALRDLFTDDGFEVTTCSSFDDALPRCREQSFTVAIFDLRLQGKDEIELLERIQATQPGIRTIIYTANKSFDSAKNAINRGAFAYVEKCGDPAELLSQVHRAVKEQLSEALSESEQRYRDLLDDAMAIVWECELPNWRFTFVSQHAESILGYPVAQWMDEPDFWVNHIHAEDREQCVQFCRDSSERGEDHEFEYRAIAADGRIVWLKDRVRVVRDKQGMPVRLRGVMFDITDMKQAEKAQRESESRYRSLVQNAPVCIHEIDLQARVASINPAGVKMICAKDEAAVVGQEYLCIVGEGDRRRIESLMKRAFEGEAAEFEFTGQVNGETRCFSSNFIPVVNDRGVTEKLIGTSEDVTDRRADEKALRESEEKFRVLTEESPAVVLIARADRIVYCNQMLATLTGYSIDELQSMNFLRIIHPDDRELVADRHRRRLAGETVPHRYEIKFVTKDGVDRWFDLSAQRIDFESQPAVLVTLVHISERKLAEQRIQEMEAQLAHVSRLSTMGEMVTGIAHEINQPLAAISNFADACGNALETIDCGDDLPIAIWLQQISQQALRCGEIIHRLRGFVHKGNQQWELVDLNCVVRDSVALIGSDIRHRSVQIHCSLPDASPLVAGSTVQLQQVLVNLLRNACEATHEHPAPEIHIDLTVDDDGARLIVRDNGPGVDQEQHGKLFDAFYTTKPEGMGIGLAISKSIIEKHQGNLRFDPAVQTGAKFDIHLPLLDPSQRDAIK